MLAGLSVAVGASAYPPLETGFLNRTVTVGGEQHRYQVFVPVDYTPTRRWPVILFLHGAGERGTDGVVQTEVGLGSALRRHSERYPAIVVFPQVSPDERWTGPAAEVALEALEQTEREFSTDRQRVYLTGMSMGGSGAWYLAYRNPQRFVALLIICARIIPVAEAVEPIVPPEDGPPYAALARRLKNVPTWLFHGDADDVVPVVQSRQVNAALQAVGAASRYTELAGVGHNAWDSAYGSPEVPRWLLAQRRHGSGDRPEPASKQTRKSSTP